jgi:hypothetical protein
LMISYLFLKNHTIVFSLQNCLVVNVFSLAL